MCVLLCLIPYPSRRVKRLPGNVGNGLFWPFCSHWTACLPSLIAVGYPPGRFSLFLNRDEFKPDRQPIQAPPQQAQRKRNSNYELYAMNSLMHGLVKE